MYGRRLGKMGDCVSVYLCVCVREKERAFTFVYNVSMRIRISTRNTEHTRSRKISKISSSRCNIINNSGVYHSAVVMPDYIPAFSVVVGLVSLTNICLVLVPPYVRRRDGIYHTII